MSVESKEIFVYADWFFLKEPTLIGTIYVNYIKGKEVFSFEYSNSWLEKCQYSFFDPDLPHFSGRQYLPFDKLLFGAFSDSCPNRWGRTLMKRRESILAKEEKRLSKTLLESDFLLGVEDISRSGALRFKLALNGNFLNHDEQNPIPGWISLRELEQSSVFLESENVSVQQEKNG